ncbi:MAG: helix-turn-helix domain-containing protein, partial [Pedococcus sp.]
SPRHAATQLHVHVNTVSQRLERISALLGPHWQQPDPALELQLALRLRRLSAGVSPRTSPPRPR